MFYDSKIGNKSVSYRLNDPELNEEEKMKWLAEQKFASQSEYYSPYNYDAQKNFINGISNELISKSNESYAYRYGIASAIATLQGISVDQVLQNYDAYKAMYTGGVDLDDKSFASAFADSWKSESANRKIASLQNKYDKSTDEEYKEYLLEQIEKAEHHMHVCSTHLSRRAELVHNDFETTLHLRVVRQILGHIGINIHMEHHDTADHSQGNRYCK